jgi:phosphatidylserine/phosphatidylglycerophosphate/cardiolipin synthase-like enzyme
MRWRYPVKPWWEKYPDYMFHFESKKKRTKDYVPPKPVYGLSPSSEVLHNHIGSVVGEFYIGSGVGNYMLSDLENARKSIKIISPYLSDSFLDILFKKSAGGCNVSIITLQGSSSPGDPIGQKKLILNAVRQTTHTNQDLLARRKRWLPITLGLLIIFTIAFFVFAFFLLIDENILRMATTCMALSLLGFLSCLFLRRYIRKIRVNFYDYNFTFPFKILKSSKNSEYRLHQKIYIIDDEIVYIGSFNFTYSGCKNNLETSLKIDQSTEQGKNAVEKVIQYFYKLMDETHLPQFSPEDCGRLYFWEDYYGLLL